MTISTDVYVDEPIVMVSIEGAPDEAEIDQMHEETATACDRFGVCYLILDMRGAQATLHEGIALLLSQELLDRRANERLRVTVVGQAEPNESTENFDYHIFSDPDQALAHVRQRIASGGR